MTTHLFTLVRGVAAGVGVDGTMDGAVGTTVAASHMVDSVTASHMVDSDTAAGLGTVADTAAAVMGAESFVARVSLVMFATALLFVAAACDGARDVDYRPSRGISADIGATHETGATSLRRGMTTEGEPLGAMPWQLGQRHQE